MLHPSLPQARRGMGARAVAGGPRGGPDDVSRVNSGRTILKQYRETGRVTGIEPSQRPGSACSGYGAADAP